MQVSREPGGGHGEEAKDEDEISGEEGRGSAGPIRAEPLYCQFDLPVRRHPIGSYEFFLSLYLVPDNLYVCRASRL